MNKRKLKLTFVFLILLLVFLINYNSMDGFITKSLDNLEYGKVERIVDGDTLIINGSSCRLLGINTPERGEKYYSEAKNFLEQNSLNKTFKIVYGKDKIDRYGRKLIYLFDGQENLNKKIVENGFANNYFPSGKDEYFLEFQDAWENCIESGKYLCEKSSDKCSLCIELSKFDYKNQKIILKNNCGFECDLTKWTIKDEGRKKFIFGNFILKKGEFAEITEKDFNETYVWTLTGDTLFLRDSQEKLILWKNF